MDDGRDGRQHRLPGARDEDRCPLTPQPKPLPLVMGGQGRPDWKIGMKRDDGGAAGSTGGAVGSAGAGGLTGLARFRRMRRLQRRYDRLQRHRNAGRERDRQQVLSDFGNPARGIIIGLGVTIAVGLLGRCACAAWGG